MTEPFGMEVQDGVVYMRLVGSLNNDNLEALTGQIEEAKKLVLRTHDETARKVPVLFDTSEFTGTYNVSAMMQFKDLEATNRPHVAKTALFGGSAAARVAAEITIELTGQDNLKLFATKEEAASWLNS